MRPFAFAVILALICACLHPGLLRAESADPVATDPVATDPVATHPVATDPVTTDPVTEHLRQRLETRDRPGTLQAGGQVLMATPWLQELYEARGYAMLWLQARRPLPAALELPDAIRSAREEGLRPEHYHLEALELALARVLDGRADLEPQFYADLELLASDAFLTLARHYADGKVDPLAIDPKWFVPAPAKSLLPYLEAVRDIGNTPVKAALQSLLPTHPTYAALRSRLALQRTLRDSASATRVDAGHALRRGETGLRVRALARRLAELGDLQPAWRDADRFDEVVEGAVMHFQRRHGLDADGVVGAQTLAALNVSPEQRINQLKVNMERWRWLPGNLGSEYLLVNIASFEMSVHADGVEIMRQPVVVGRPYRMTPVFSHQMTYLVLNPSWEVPPSLAVQDLLPQIRKDPEHIAKMGFSVLRGWGTEEEQIDPGTIDWQAADPQHFPFRLRQRPGPLNALGRVKFMFPNAHNVYLHDTPARGDFVNANRAVSSGCIRLSDPMALVDWLLLHRPNAAQLRPEQISAILDSGKETTIRLSRPLPIHLLYWTAWIEDDHVVHYRRDVYRRDGAVLEALLGKAPAVTTAAPYHSKAN